MFITRTMTLSLLLLVVCATAAVAQTTSFTYQGKLTDNSMPANGTYQMQFSLFANASGGTPIGNEILTNNSVTVTNGIFTVELTFTDPAAFDGSTRWLEIAVKRPADPGFTTLANRQKITSTPYAIKTRFLSTAGNGNLFAGQGAGNVNNGGANNVFVGSDTGHSNVMGSSNSFFGFGAGFNNDSGGNNTFLGTSAGFNSSGGLANGNTFVGSGSGTGNTTGRSNTMLGFQANTPFPGALINATAIGNRAFVTQDNSLVLGSIAGVNSATADTFVGIGTTAPSERLHVVGNGLFTGNLTVNGTLNATLPTGSGNYIQNQSASVQDADFNILGNGTAGTLSANVVNATTQFNLGGNRVLSGGSNNLFAGIGAGTNNTGGGNAFFGFQAGQANGGGGGNAFFGFQAGNANSDGFNNAFFGFQAGQANTNGNANAFYGYDAGFNNTIGVNNTFIGAFAHFNFTANPTGNFNTLLGSASRVTSGTNNATAIGYLAQVSQSNSLILGSINGINGCTPAMNCDSVNVAIGTTNPAAKLHITGTGIIRARVDSDSNAGLALTLSNQPKWSVATVTGGQFQIFNDAIGQNAVWIDSTTNNVGIGTTSPSDKLEVNGVLRVDFLGSAGGVQLCRNISNQISNCSSSLRYKTNINEFTRGLDLVNRLSPITFNWKQGGMRDFGLGAEDVEKVEPLLVTRNDKGEIEGVKYDRVAVVLINAVKEQQAQIESQQKLIENQQRELDALKKLVCANSKAKGCKQ